jgi:hypothetical protein
MQSEQGLYTWALCTTVNRNKEFRVPFLNVWRLLDEQNRELRQKLSVISVHAESWVSTCSLLSTFWISCLAKNLDSFRLRSLPGVWGHTGVMHTRFWERQIQYRDQQGQRLEGWPDTVARLAGERPGRCDFVLDGWANPPAFSVPYRLPWQELPSCELMEFALYSLRPYWSARLFL